MTDSAREIAGAAVAEASRFGAHMLEHWHLDPDVTYLNHGTVGATPKRVLEFQRVLRDRIEREPAQFMLRDLTGTEPVGASRRSQPALREAADRVGAFVGAQGDDLVFVDNVTTGVNAVLRSFPFESGDHILMTDLAYGAVRYTADYVARVAGLRLDTVSVDVPARSSQGVLDALEAGLQHETRLVIVDHIASSSALLLPVREIAELCHARGALLLVDGAHAPGSVKLDIPALGADWYVGNLHKWALVPRSSAILWATPEQQAVLHPAVISWGLDQGYVAEFDLVGTRDPTPHLTAPAALDLLEEWGFENMLRYNHDLVWEGAQLLADRWGTAFETPRSMVATMATVPLPATLGNTVAQAKALRDALLFEDQIEVHVGPQGDGLAVRVAAQVYNSLCDFEHLADSVLERAK